MNFSVDESARAGGFFRAKLIGRDEARPKGKK
jgi:hypothetical protein